MNVVFALLDPLVQLQYAFGAEVNTVRDFGDLEEFVRKTFESLNEGVQLPFLTLSVFVLAKIYFKIVTTFVICCNFDWQ